MMFCHARCYEIKYIKIPNIVFKNPNIHSYDVLCLFQTVVKISMSLSVLKVLNLQIKGEQKTNAIRPWKAWYKSYLESQHDDDGHVRINSESQWEYCPWTHSETSH